MIPELAVGITEVCLDGLLRDEQGLRECPVSLTCGGHRGHPALRMRERCGTGGPQPPWLGTARHQLFVGASGDGRRAASHRPVQRLP